MGYKKKKKMERLGERTHKREEREKQKKDH
jgi:hypothetical protein